MTLKIRAIGRARKYASGGYLSRLSPAPDGGGALSSPMAFVPPVTLKFQEVERALPPALDLVPIALKKESAEAAAAQAKEMTDGVAKAIAENKHWNQAQREEATAAMKQMEKDIERRLIDDPMHFANRMNLKRLQTDITGVLNDPRHGAWNSQAEARKNMGAIHTQAGTLNDLYQDEEGRPKIVNGRYITNKEYVELYGSRGADDAEYQQAYGASKDNRVGEFRSNNRTGTMKDADGWLKNLVDVSGKNSYKNLVEKYSQNQEEWDAINRYVMKTAKGNGWSDNQVQIEAAKLLAARDWKNVMDPAARHGIEQNATRAWLDERWNAKDNPENLTNREALALAQRNPGLAKWLEEDREAFTQHFGETYVADRLDISKARSTESSYSENAHMLGNPTKTGSGDEDEDGPVVLPIGTPQSKFSRAKSDSAGLTSGGGLGHFFFYGGHDVSVYHGWETSEQPNKDGEIVEGPIATVGRTVYVLEDEGITFRGVQQGKPQQGFTNIQGDEDEPLMRVRNTTVPVVTRVVSKSGAPVTKDNTPRGTMVTIGLNGTAGITKEAPPRVDGRTGEEYFERPNGDRVYIQHVSGQLLRKGDTTYYITDDRDESIFKYGKNLSFNRAQENYIADNGSPRTNTPAYIQMMATAADERVQGDVQRILKGEAPQGQFPEVAKLVAELSLLENFLKTNGSKSRNSVGIPVLQTPFSDRPYNLESAKHRYNKVMDEISDQLTREHQKLTKPAPNREYKMNARERSKSRYEGRY